MASNRCKSKSSDTIHYNYTVTLRLQPVECGMKCYTSQGVQQFKGLNAFNNYFQYLLSEHNGFSLPDVWDGYYHITLRKFRLNLDRYLESRENDLINYIKAKSLPEQHYATVFPCKFRTTELSVYSGEGRYAEAKGIDFVTLKVQSLDNAFEKLYPFLEIVKAGVESVGGKWQPQSMEDSLKEWHVTIRKYKDSASKWSSNFIQNCGIIEYVQQNPLEFECVALDIAQTRRQARQGTSRQWWIDATGVLLQCDRCDKYFQNDSPGRCSKCGCHGGGHMCSKCGLVVRKKWAGNCDRCKSYERLNPLWSTNS
jgi:hypothetical protein